MSFGIRFRFGLLNKFMSFPITSELFPTPSVDIVFDAQVIDMAEAFFDGVVMTGVLHHISY